MQRSVGSFPCPSCWPSLSPPANAQSSSHPASAPDAQEEEELEEQIAANWRERFDEVYRLDEGQVVKRIAPPFIPERLEYYRQTDKGQAQAILRGPDYYRFRWDGELKRHSMTFGSPSSLADALEAVGLQRFEYEGPPNLLRTRLPGDWIVRDDSSRESRLAALEKIVRDDWEEPLRFVRKPVERKVIVVRGTYEFHPLEDALRSPKDVHLFSEDFDTREGAGGGTGDMDGFLRHVGDRLNRPIINEITEAPRRVSWTNHRSGYVRNGEQAEEQDEIVEKVIRHLTEQTSLEFRQELRTMDVWFVTEGPASQPAPASSLEAPAQGGLQITWCVANDRDFAGAGRQTAVVRPGQPLKASPPQEGWDLELNRRDGRFQFDYSYGPCRLLDMGAGPLDLSAEFEDGDTTWHNPRSVLVQVGHVYLLEQGRYQRWVLFRVDAVSAPTASVPANADN